MKLTKKKIDHIIVQSGYQRNAKPQCPVFAESEARGGVLCQTEGDVLRPCQQTRTKCFCSICTEIPTLIDYMEHDVSLMMNVCMVKVNELGIS